MRPPERPEGTGPRSGKRELRGRCSPPSGDVDILLVQTPNVRGTFFNLPGMEIPLSLCSLAAYVKSRGLRVAVLDLQREGADTSALEYRLRRSRPALVGLTSYTPNVGLAAEIAGRVKATLPEAKVVLGGFHASALPERTAREFPRFDCIVVGEGEITLRELFGPLTGGGALSGVAGLCYRSGDTVRLTEARPLVRDLDGLPFPDRGLVPVTEYLPDPGNYYQLPSTGILFSRGCPYRCAFCSKSVFGDRIRYRSVENFLAEVEACIGTWGIRDFRLEDEAPTVNMSKIRALCEAILRRGLSVTWNCFSRVDSVDDGILRLMKAAGCYHITYGIESSLPETLERIGKNDDPKQTEEAIRLTKKWDIECKANFILGFPWETPEAMRTVADYAKRAAPDLATFNLFKPFPGSALFSELETRGGLRHRAWEAYFTTGEQIPFDACYSEDEARRILKGAVFSFYFRPAYLVQRLRRLARHPRRDLVMTTRGVAILLRELWRARPGAAAVRGGGHESTPSG